MSVLLKTDLEPAGLYAALPNCSKDDIDFYYESGVYVFAENSKKRGTESLLDKGTWSLSDDENTLSIESTVEDSREFDIIQLTENKFIYSENLLMDDEKNTSNYLTHTAE